MCEEAGDKSDGLVWDSVTYRTHVRRTSKRKWERSIARAESADAYAKSQYNPSVAEQRIQCIEMKCARGKIGFKISQTDHGENFFARIDADEWLGVSAGEFTNYVFVVKQRGGKVHGYPITRSDLLTRKRARASDVDAKPSKPC